MTEQICDALNEHLKPKGVAVIVDARHMCMEMRGVQKICSTTITSSLRGLLKVIKKQKMSSKCSLHFAQFLNYHQHYKQVNLCCLQQL